MQPNSANTRTLSTGWHGLFAFFLKTCSHPGGGARRAASLLGKRVLPLATQNARKLKKGGIYVYLETRSLKREAPRLCRRDAWNFAQETSGFGCLVTCQTTINPHKQKGRGKEEDGNTEKVLSNSCLWHASECLHVKKRTPTENKSGD